MSTPAPNKAPDYYDRVEQFLGTETAGEAVRYPFLKHLRAAGHFALMVIRGFDENRGPMRAASLSYTTLLALIPLLAVMLSVSKNFLHDSAADMVPQLLDKAISMVAPQLEYMPLGDSAAPAAAPATPAASTAPAAATAAAPAQGKVVMSSEARKRVLDQIQSSIGNINAGALGTVGTILLIVVAIQLLMTIEQAFNDIWGVRVGRSIWRKIVYYWTAITLGPLLLVFAVAVTSSVQVAGVYGKLTSLPIIGRFSLELLPYVLLWISFAFAYGLMPNTQVKLRAALIGGIVAGTLWQVNSMLNTLYISRVVGYSKVYGSLGIIPVFLLGVYFSWLIVLLGAQVSFAVQNARAYMQERASQKVDQAGRERVACRVVLTACHQFLTGEKPPTITRLAETLGAPLHLLNHLIPRLVDGGLLREVAGESPGLLPARPPETITVADVLHVVRTTNGRCGEAVASTEGDVVAKTLHALDATGRAAPANARFSELAARPKA